MGKKEIARRYHSIWSFFNRRSISRHLQQGLTLTELLIAIAVLSILLSSLVVLIDPAAQFRKSRDATRKSDLSQIRAVLELYRSDWGSYPPEDSAGGVSGITESGPSQVIVCGGPLARSGTTYMQRVPCDPLRPTPPYNYYYSATGDAPSTYSLIGCLENTSDPQKDPSNNATYCDGTNNWSYTLQNP